MSAVQLITLAKQKGLKLTTAESCTGGLVSAALTDIPGSSAVFERGFVTYANAAKMDMLGVHGITLERFGAVSEETAREMAEGALQRAGADIAVAISGIAGPGGSETKPEGRVCYAIATKAETLSETVEHGALGRAQVRAAATRHALQLLTDAMQEQ